MKTITLGVSDSVYHWAWTQLAKLSAEKGRRVTMSDFIRESLSRNGMDVSEPVVPPEQPATSETQAPAPAQQAA